MKVEDDQFLPGFASALEGLNAGDSKDITVTIPDTFPITELRGQGTRIPCHCERSTGKTASGHG